MENFQKLEINDYEHWKLMLHSNQCYLGRCVVWCKRPDVVDFFDMTKDERDELWVVTKNLRGTLRRLFKPDLMNYSSFANITPHLHIHVVPRYSSKVIFENFEFRDEQWGKNYSPYDRDFKIPDELLEKIKRTIKTNL